MSPSLDLPLNSSSALGLWSHCSGGTFVAPYRYGCQLGGLGSWLGPCRCGAACTGLRFLCSGDLDGLWFLGTSFTPEEDAAALSLGLSSLRPFFSGGALGSDSGCFLRLERFAPDAVSPARVGGAASPSPVWRCQSFLQWLA